MVLLLSDINFFMYIAQKVLSAPATCLKKTRFTPHSQGGRGSPDEQGWNSDYCKNYETQNPNLIFSMA